MPRFEGVVDRFRALVDREPDAPMYAFADDGGRITERLSRLDLLARMDSLGGFLRERCGLRPGDRAILVYPPSMDFVNGFVACLGAGVIPVPVYPPNPLRLAQDLEGFGAIVEASGARVALTNREYARGRKLGGLRDLLKRSRAQWPPELSWHGTDAVKPGAFRRGETPPVGADDVALLQYTSGSTAAPKGVMITHLNIVHQLEFNRDTMHYGRDTRGVSWLPPYHDFGLISAILSALMGNGQLTMFSPLAFVSRPGLWFDLIHGERATHTGAPNFAYELAVSKTTPEQRAAWDLSCLEVVMSAAEPVRPATVRRFLEAFAPAGLRPEAFCPAYGLAEHTVGVTVRGKAVVRFDRSALERDGRALPASAAAPEAEVTELVGCGAVPDGIAVRIVHPESRRPCEAGTVGEIWVDSPSKAAGYWGAESATARLFQARIEDEPSSRTWLRTGDLGLLHADELFVCGRLKDLLILAGKNVYPQDIELSAERSDERIRPGCVTAFSVERHGREALVVVAELRDPRAGGADGVAESIRAAVARDHGLTCQAVALIAPRTLPKTSSGKVQRRRCRQRWLDGALELVHASEAAAAVAGSALSAAPTAEARAPSAPDLPALLRAAVAEQLQLPEERVPVDEPLMAHGVDSLQAVAIADRLGAQLGHEVPVALVLRHPTIEELAAALAAGADAAAPSSPSASPAGSPAPTPGPPGFEAALYHPTADTQRLWRIARSGRSPAAALHLGALVEVVGHVDERRLDEAVTALARRHGALRSAFLEDGGRLWVRVASEPRLALEVEDLEAPDPEEEAEARHRERTAREFDLAAPSLWRIALLRSAPADRRWLSISAHHLVSDMRSFEIVAAELLRALQGAPLEASDVDERAQQELRRLEQASSAEPPEAPGAGAPPAPLGLRRAPEPGSTDVPAELVSARTELPEALGRRLADVAGRLGVLPAAVHLAAYEVLLARLAGERRFVLGVPLDSRLVIRSREAVGFLSSPLPLVADVDERAPAPDLIRAAHAGLVDRLDGQGSLASQLRSAGGRPAPLEALFNPVGFGADLSAGGVTLRARHAGRVASDVALMLVVQQSPSGGVLRLEATGDVCSAEGCEALLRAHVAVLDALVAGAEAAPAAAVADCAADAVPALAALRPAERAPLAVSVCATFTTDPLVDVLERWGRVLGRPMAVAAAAYGQVLQSLLGDGSEAGAPAARIVLVRLADLSRDRAEEADEAFLAGWCDELVVALERSVARTGAVHLVGVAPTRDPSALVARLEGALEERLGALPGVRPIRRDEWHDPDAPPVEFDAASERAGHLPYTRASFALVGTLLARRLYRVAEPPPKVIAVDGDNTLWRGVVGEDGVSGIVFDDVCRRLHARLLACREAGVLLALCSKNDPDLVTGALSHPDSRLAPEHFAAIQAHWRPKSESLVEVAERIGLSLDTFAFLDDSPVEIGEVRSRLPEVAAVQVPGAGEADGFADHLWLLDPGPATEVDRRRARMLEDEAERRAELGETGDLAAFLERLGLEIAFEEVGADNLARAHQLTQRTSQFNFTGAKPAQAELARECAAPETVSTLARVADRFGEYGQVGLVVARPRHDVLDVEQLLLSCRALGRGVEHRLLNWLGERCAERGLSRVRLRIRRTERNAPARAFLAAVGRWAGQSVDADADEPAIDLSAEQAQRIGFRDTLEAAAPPAPSARGRVRGDRIDAERLGRVARESGDPARLRALLGLSAGAGAPAAAGGEGDLTGRVQELFASVLGRPSVPADASFLDLGGTSLDAVELVSRLQGSMGVALELDEVLAHPTARSLGEALRARSGSGALARSERGTTLAQAMSRDLGLVADHIPFQDREWEPRPAQRILVTGANGFVGCFLTMELLRRTRAHLVCLVRGRDDAEARERLRAAFRQRELPWSREVERRTTCLAGDLSAPRLGLSEAAWDELGESIDGIFHCGAAVHFTKPYEALRGANVLGTLEVLKLAVTGRLKKVSYVSTLSVLHVRGVVGAPELEEGAALPNGAALYIGYQQSKWVAEGLVGRAAERGVPVTIFRPGVIAPHSHTGVYSETDLFVRLLMAADRCGSLPRSRAVDAAPVDWVCRAIVEIQGPEHLGRTFHLVHPEPTPVESLARTFRLAGWVVRLDGLDAWIARMAEQAAADRTHPLAPLAPLLKAPPEDNYLRLVLTAPRVSTRRTEAALAAAGVRCPELDRRLLGRWFDRFASDGALGALGGDEADGDAARRYLWFDETMRGHCALSSEAGRGPERFEAAAAAGERAGHTLDLEMKAWLRSPLQLQKDGTVRVEGRVVCPLIHPEPLVIRSGGWTLRPDEGVAEGRELRATLLRYDLELEAADGRAFRLEGVKTARPWIDVARQSRTLDVAIFDARGSEVCVGRSAVSTDGFVDDQLLGLSVRDDLPADEARQAKALWLAHFGLQAGRTWLALAQRLAASLWLNR